MVQERARRMLEPEARTSERAQRACTRATSSEHSSVRARGEKPLCDDIRTERAAERTAMRTAREQRDASAQAGPCERQSAMPCKQHASSAMPAPMRAQRAVASVSHSIAQEARASARRSSLRGGRVPREWPPVGGPTAWGRTTGRYRPPHAPVDRGSDWQQPRAVDCHPPGLRVVEQCRAARSPAAPQPAISAQSGQPGSVGCAPLRWQRLRRSCAGYSFNYCGLRCIVTRCDPLRLRRVISMVVDVQRSG